MPSSRDAVASISAATSSRDGAPGRTGAATSSTDDKRSLAISRWVAAPAPAGRDHSEHDGADGEQHGDQPPEGQHRERRRTAGADHDPQQRQDQRDPGDRGDGEQPHPSRFVLVHERPDTFQKRRDRSARDGHDVALPRGGSSIAHRRATAAAQPAFDALGE
jgi:hypothetical protein